MDYTYLEHNVSRIRQELGKACEESGYDPSRVTLMAAVKSGSVEEINALHTLCGINHIGENRVQQLLERYDKLEREGLSIHFIGTLQTNKVKYIADKVDCIQSLDSEKLAREIEKQCAKINRIMDVLIEINSGSEISKSGVEPEETRDFAHRITSGDYPHLRLRGFMTMAPRSTEEEYRVIFGNVRKLCASVWDELPMRDTPMQLSMGMSESYVPAAAEGATLVRVGRGMFQKPIEHPEANSN
ncbi:MAG: YggS family pyridoxal phosphate-dependent enzyme [Clostridia bacterium]|nr:YggS family pyridoxal phosphate-dependent enzyme [Clostridia bacterium]